MKRNIAASMAVLMAATTAFPVTVQASANSDVRKKVIGMTGIMSVSTNMDAFVSRAEFAQMLVKASSYRETVSSVSNVSVYADVPRNSEYASYIRIASEQGWMTGYLGGQFRPEQQVTLQEASRGLLGLLGYTAEDFTGDVAGARLSKFYFLELNEEIDREASELITRTDCVNLFYNLLKTDTKAGNTHYGSILDCELTADGELNPLSMADNSVKGPKLVKKNNDLSNYVPFKVNEASIYLDGQPSTAERIKSLVSDGTKVVLYYNTAAKTIWAYSDHSDMENGRSIASGKITHIYYSSADVMTPSSVILDDDTGVEYKLSSSEMQFAFSVYGTLQVGDKVTLVCEKTTNSNGDETYSVIDYIEE